jgi:hypothetical protein
MPREDLVAVRPDLLLERAADGEVAVPSCLRGRRTGHASRVNSRVVSQQTAARREGARSG